MSTLFVSRTGTLHAGSAAARASLAAGSSSSSSAEARAITLPLAPTARVWG